MASVAPPQSQPPAMTLDSVMAPMARPLASSQSTPLLASYDPPPSQAPRERKRTKSMPSFILMADEERMPRPQKPRYKDDMYSPRWVRYSGHLKEGYCETCPEGRWLQLKNSAYWYHKQFYHGISSVTGKRFAEALQQRIGPDGILQGLCHQCGRFVPICNGKKRRNHLLWYKHAHKCHIYIKPEKFSHPV
ncbi:hypothetical protein BX666DRAFT_1917682 [Dichotomocladium elegans]|nr:hypothetical protein BX666DRAFT_1917682 [Dichotomocladium elegans]